MQNIDAIRRIYLDVPDEAIFLERAIILQDAGAKYESLPPGLRQGKILEELCERITVVVNPGDVLLGRISEKIPTPEDEVFIEQHPELFIMPGLPGYLDSASIYIPDWRKLLEMGIGGLMEEVQQHKCKAKSNKQSQDYLDGVYLSLLSASRLINRYAERAKQMAEELDYGSIASTQLLEVAKCCQKIALSPPESFREALQLFTIFHTILSCIIGGRNITPGRMDQYLFPFYKRDIDSRRIAHSEAVELLAIMMLHLSQLTGSIATDFQSKKRSPNKYSHYYITLAGANASEESSVNEFSFAFLEALSLVNHREPSLSIRYRKDMDREFWHKTLELMKTGRPVFAYNDEIVIVVYKEKMMTLEEFISILRKNFSESETFRQYLLNRVPYYGSNDRDVMDMIKRLGDMWVEEVRKAGEKLDGITLRPGFHSWLYNIQMGKETSATPDGRLQGESLSSDQLPGPGRTGAPTEVLESMAHLSHDYICSGGTILRLDPSHFRGKTGTDKLVALIKTYFEKGGLQLHFTFADISTLQDALENPDRHMDLLVRVTGFSEYFIRLLPEVQQEIMRRFQYE